MGSGIYVYTFKSGKCYIGQAIDIPKRWEQHSKKMKEGTHTKLIQAEYDTHGMPSFSVLVYCHPHYLDWLEAAMIHEHRPELNTTIPKLFINEDLDFKLDVQWVERPLHENYNQYCALMAQTEGLNLEVDFLTTKVNVLEARVIQVAKENAPKEIKDLLEERQRSIEYLHDIYMDVKQQNIENLRRVQDYQERIIKYNAKRWYQKLFTRV